MPEGCSRSSTSGRGVVEKRMPSVDPPGSLSLILRVRRHGIV
jgi:hypothetical protein